MYKGLQSLDGLTINFNESGIHIVNVILALVMFGIALDIKVSDFKKVFLHPKSLIVGLCSQFILLPAVTFLIVIIAYDYIPQGVAMGMILVASCPGGNMSNFMTALAKANTALSISLTGFMTVLAVFMTPLNFEIWGKLYLRFLSRHSFEMLQPLEISFSQMLFTMTILLALPLCLGMLFSNYLPRVKNKLVKPLKFVSLFAFFLILAFALANNLDIFFNNLKYIFIIVLIHNGMAFLSGYTIASSFKLPKKDRVTVMIETGIQNSGLGLALLFNPKIFPAGTVTGGMLLVVAWWGVWHIFSGLSIAYFFRKLNYEKDTGI